MLLTYCSVALSLIKSITTQLPTSSGFQNRIPIYLIAIYLFQKSYFYILSLSLQFEFFAPMFAQRSIISIPAHLPMLNSFLQSP